MSDHETVIDVINLHKTFKLPTHKNSSIKSAFTTIGRKKNKGYVEQKALKDITFSVNKGEFFGIVGRNGSGKSTLLKILAGIYQPTKGSVSVKGKIVPFIELGVGFKQELSGRDNVYLNGAMLGFTTKQIDEKFESIVEFAELEAFMEQKLSNYSSGMQVRLAFSVATILAESDVLLLDEVLAVGDAEFQRKCFDYFRKLKKMHKTVIFISHDMSAIREYCDRVLMIENGTVKIVGSADEVAKEYVKLFIDTESQDEHKVKNVRDKKFGDGKITFRSAKTDKKIYSSDKNSHIILQTEIIANKSVDTAFSVGFLIKNASGQPVMGTNTAIENIIMNELKENQKAVVQWSIPNIFGDDTFSIDVAVTSLDGSDTYQWWEESCSFVNRKNMSTPYLISPSIPTEITYSQ